MILRAYRPSDRKELERIHAANDYGFPMPKNMRSYFVIADENDVPVMAAGYVLKPEVTIICPQGGKVHPMMKLKGIALLHEALRAVLVGNGFKRAFSFLAPKAERAFGRHLRRHFGWKETWTAYAIDDWRANGQGH